MKHPLSFELNGLGHVYNYMIMRVLFTVFVGKTLLQLPYNCGSLKKQTTKTSK